MELGLHIADFTWDGGAPELASMLARLARTAEDAGVSRLTVMDHLWQIEGVGSPEDPMLEAYTTLGFLAGVTSRVRLHALVTAAVYREPGMLAKMVTTLRRPLGRSRGSRHRRGLERGGGARARPAVPVDQGALRAARGDRADLRADVE